MKHAGNAALDGIEPLLDALRGIDGMIEKKRGVFYRRAQAFLHFHEDPAGMFADLRVPPGVRTEEPPDADGWVRLPASTVRERRTLVGVVRRALKAPQ